MNDISKQLENTLIKEIFDFKSKGIRTDEICRALANILCITLIEKFYFHKRVRYEAERLFDEAFNELKDGSRYVEVLEKFRKEQEIEEVENVDFNDSVKKRLDHIRGIRASNNVNWMGILELAIMKAPEEACMILKRIEDCDGIISEELTLLLNTLEEETAKKILSQQKGVYYQIQDDPTQYPVRS